MIFAAIKILWHVRPHSCLVNAGPHTNAGPYQMLSEIQAFGHIQYILVS